MKKITALLFTLILCIPIIAQENNDLSSLKNELKDASTITEETSRLAAYDQILIKYSIKEQIKNSSSSKWEVSVDTDPIDDSKQIVFVLKADSGESDYGSPIYLIIRYSNNDTQMYVNWSDYLGSEAYVTIRVGADKASTREWSLSTTSKATFYPGNDVELINRILGVEKVVIQCTPYNSNPITAVFDVSGLKVEAEQYMADLNW